ncbi:mCG1005, isoform CRA_a [Mus musculus]|nr:mCG1005, isoform CRA_a [Mus musculus]
MQARPCNPFSRCSKQMGASHWPDFGMVQRSISKAETGKPTGYLETSAEWLPINTSEQGPRSRHYSFTQIQL